MNLHSLLVNGVIFKDDKVLIAQRSWDEPHMPGRWTIPGGKAESHDPPVFNILEKELQKEIREETGVEVEDDMELVTNNNFTRPSDNQHVIVVVFKCRYKSGEAKPLDDTIAIKWATQSKIEEMEFPPNVKEYILKAFGKN